MTYEKLLKEAIQHGIDTYEKPMRQTVKGLYSDKIIWINKHLSTTIEKKCILAEELGHHHTSVGDILNQTELRNRKQENLARDWAYKKLIPLTKIVQSQREEIRNKYELAEFLGVTESFLEDALKWYKEKRGLYVEFEGLTICFEPLGVLEIFE